MGGGGYLVVGYMVQGMGTGTPTRYHTSDYLALYLSKYAGKALGQPLSATVGGLAGLPSGGSGCHGCHQRSHDEIGIGCSEVTISSKVSKKVTLFTDFL